MKKEDYLRLAIKAKAYTKKQWVISAFSVCKTKSFDPKTENTHCRLFQEVDGTYFYNAETKSKEAIEGTKPGIPLFQFLEDVIVDSELCPNVKGEPVLTRIGNLLVNLCVLVHPFGTKYPFVTGYFDIKKIEAKIAETLADAPEEGTERLNNLFYVDEYIEFQNALNYMQSFTQLAIWSGSEKTMVPPPGIEKLKKELIAKYGDKLKEPAYYAEFEKELEAYYKEYLKGDPNLGIFMDGKQMNPSAKKRYLTFGMPSGFKAKPTPIVTSLYEGWPTDKEGFADMVSDARAGSYSRGAETVDGGVGTKMLVKSTGNMRVGQDECESVRGIDRIHTPHNSKNLVGRYVRLSNNWKFVENKEEANALVGKPVTVRSPQYCLKPGDVFCKSCLGKNLGASPSGIVTAATNIGGIVLNSAMKAMHGTVLSTTRFDIEKHIT